MQPSPRRTTRIASAPPCTVPRWLRMAALVPLLALALPGCAASDPVDPGTDTTTTPVPPPPPPPPPPPSGTGARIDTIFAEGFESGSLAVWEDGYDASRHRIVTDAAFARQGARYLEVTHPQGSDGGFLNKFFLPGHDSVYVRYWVRLEPAWEGGTKFVALYGSRIDNQWSAFGKAGICPTGTDFFNSMVVSEPTGGSPGPLRFYTYFPDMARDAGGTCWGNYGDATTTYVPPLTITRGEWHKIELWLKINTVGQRNAHQRFWVDDVQRGEWSGFRVRTTTDLRINALQLTFSICCGGAPRTQRAYVDDILVATGRP
jgi:hypothetical protein